MQNRIFYGKYLQCVALLLSLALLCTVFTGPTLAYIVTGTTSLINTFISGLAPEGGIIIRKTVEHPFGDTYVIPEDIAFDFRVELGPDYASKTVNTTQGRQIADSNGNITVTLKPGESVAIREIIAGTSVTVTELAQSPGFTASNGVVSQTVTIVAREDTIVRFVNKYVPAPVSDVNLEVIGVKNLEGRPWQEGDTFTFQLEYRYIAGGSSQWTELGTASVTYDPEQENFNCFDLTELVRNVDYKQIGIYSFRVSEIEGVIGGITYDELCGYFDIHVSDVNMDGRLEFSSVTATAAAEVVWNEALKTHCVTVTFSNQYAPTGSAAVSIPIHKTVEDRSGVRQTAQGFTFELYTLDGQLLQTSEPTSASGESGLRLVYEAEQAGQTFTYIVKETGAGTVEGAMSYDATEYTVNVTVTDNLDGTVSAEADVQDLYFVNVYDPQDTAVLLTGTKILEGRDLREGEFTFQIYPTNAEFVKAPEALPVFTAMNTADGSFTFGPMIYNQVGTYHYIVCEDASAAQMGITYDDSIYYLTVTVTDENGILSAKTSITTPDGQISALQYRNTYHPVAALLQLGGRKVLEGATLEQGQFHFKLFAADENFAPEGLAVQTVTNTAEGTFSFDPLVYEQPGTYHYIIREEIITRVEDVIYDDTVYGVTVIVTDNGYGALLTQTEIICIGGSAANEIVFENVYRPQGPTDPDDPDDPDDPEEPEVPKTGYPMTLLPYVIMLALSVVLLTMVVFWDKLGWRDR